MEVTVSVEIADHIEWKIAIEMKDNRILEWVNFPQLAVPNDLRDCGGSSKILWGFNEGGLVSLPKCIRSVPQERKCPLRNLLFGQCFLKQLSAAVLC